MKDLRLAFESEVLSWPHVTTRFMFGCLAYMLKGKLFAFFVDDSVVITQLDNESRESLAAEHEAFAFESKGKTIGGWMQVVVADCSELEEIMDYVRKSYAAALAKA
ncbi:MAG: hypothetical protein E3J71_09400 [Candidatus Stahlbacteria bacterium]|nr:MAG: hypothetical protein E3J71_09400 [Candidatus Stahlbacteria bacterium]